MTPDRRPARVSAVLSLLAALAATGAAGLFSPLALLCAATGAVTLAAGLVAASRSWLTVGAVGLLAGVLVAGLAGTPTPAVLVGAVATLVAWDLAENAVALGEQLGREAETVRAETVHAGVSAGVGAVSIGAAIGVASLARPLPLSALVVAIAAGVVLFAGMRL